MLALALRTTAQIRNIGLPDRGFTDVKELREKNQELDGERNKLQDEVTKLKASAYTDEETSKKVSKQLREYRALTGYARVVGPGLEITLRDCPFPPLPGTEAQASAYLIDARDVNSVINELRAAGAEAIAVAGSDGRRFHRFVASTTIVGNGRSATVNGASIAPPYKLRVIGNPKELRAALDMPEGIVQVVGLDQLKMIVIKETQQLELPAFANTRLTDTRVDHPQAANR